MSLNVFFFFFCGGVDGEGLGFVYRSVLCLPIVICACFLGSHLELAFVYETLLHFRNMGFNWALSIDDNLIKSLLKSFFWRFMVYRDEGSETQFLGLMYTVLRACGACVTGVCCIVILP